MNSSTHGRSQVVVNVKEIVWDLLQQWKAVVAVALVVMLAMTAFKYHKDLTAYDANAAQKASIEQSGITTEERIVDVLNALPESDRSIVQYMVNQKDWADKEEEYINNSILMNTDPANQRTLLLDYYISAADTSESIITSLIYGYSGFVSSNDVIEALRDEIAPDTDSKYIAELISTNNGGGNSTSSSKSQFTSTDDDSAVVEIRIVLPDEADMSAVEKIVTDSLKGYSSEMGNKIGNHSISLIKSSEAYLYNAEAVEQRNDIMLSIYNIRVNYTKNMQTSLSDEQKAAIESITAIKQETAGADAATEEAESGTSTDAGKPGLSKKYALLGFILGALAYAFIYLLYVIFRGRINCASDAEYYTQARLLGEVYTDSKPAGLSKLLHSGFVEKIRYKGKTDADIQIEKLTESLCAVCGHAGAKVITMLDMTDNSGAMSLINEVSQNLKSMGIEPVIVKVADDFDEKALLSIENAVTVLSTDTKVAGLTQLTALCGEYDVKLLGSVYTAAL